MVHEEDVETSSVDRSETIEKEFSRSVPFDRLNEASIAKRPEPVKLVHVFLPNGSCKEMTEAEAKELESDG